MPTLLMTHRKRLKNLRHGTPILLDASTGEPALPEGIHEVCRPKIGNPLATHYGLLVKYAGQLVAFDLQNGEGPRKVSYEKFAAGRPVRVTHSLPLGPGFQASLDRLPKAWTELATWDFFKNNCEHWARYVVRGEHKSDQLIGLWIAAGIVLLVLVMKK